MQQDEQQAIQPVVDLQLPKPHILTRLVDANETYFLAARGTFKTSRGISLFLIDKTYQMPRMTGALVGLSFEHLFDNTIPPLLHALDEFGFEHGEHYVIGKEPPKDWETSYLGNVKPKYDHVISWHNGTAWALISLMKKASANGVSAQAGVFDECKFMEERQLVDEIFPIFRGNEKYFKHLPCYLSKFFATDKMADPVQINWLLKKRELNNQAKLQVVIELAIYLNDLKAQFNHATASEKQKLRPQIRAVEVRLNKLRSTLLFYVEASAYDVVDILGEKWLKDKRRNMRDHEFAVAIENKDPDRPGESFYPDYMQEKHTYDKEYDINPTKPFIIGADYQHSVAPIVVCQHTKLPGAEKQTLNFVDEVYTLDRPEGPPQANGNGKQGGLDDAIQLFCDRYKTHAKKVVYYVYDHTAIGKRVDADQYFVKVARVLKKNHWKVKHIYMGQAPSHFTKYSNTKKWLQDADILINKRCNKLQASIKGAPAKVVNGKTEKEKKNEREYTLDQSETTHFSDAWDMVNHAVLELKLIKPKSEKSTTGVR